MFEFRSAIFIPGANEKTLEKAASLDADLILFDLEDSVHQTKKEVARQLVATTIKALQVNENVAGKRIGVRINDLSTDRTLADLEAVLPAKPDLVMLPKVVSGEGLVKLDAMLGAIEAKSDMEFGSIKLMLLTAETPGSLFTMDCLSNISGRLVGMTWGAEDLATELGAALSRDESGKWLPPLQLAQTLCLVKARDLGVQALDAVYPDFRDIDGLKKECIAAKQMGYTGKLAIHPGQLEVINDVFSPTLAEVDYARRLVELFSENPGTGVLDLDGKMVDIPHLRSAEGLLARHKIGLQCDH